MAFYGCSFIFDGIPCEEYGLMIYRFDSQKQDDAEFTSTGSIQTDHIPRRNRSFLYGTEMISPLRFTLVFGGTRFDTREYLDRWEIDAISSWLTGHDTYKWLEICQTDLELVRYRCVITKLKLLTDETYPWAFSCEVTCDSPFSYEYPERLTYSVTDSLDVRMSNRSSCSKFYYPKMEIALSGGTGVKIINHSDRDRVCEFAELPSGNEMTLYMDNENQVLSCSLDAINPYEHFNFKFFRMVRGDNLLTIEGTAMISFICEFPVNTGG